MKIIKDLWLAIALIVSASALLLLSDLEQRQKTDKTSTKQYPAIAIMQISSTPLLDNHIAGVLDRLQTAGYIAKDQSNIRKFNPQGDLGTANTIAKEIVNGPYEIAITSSTLALQTLAKANLNSKKLHVFGAVTDPYGAGVGINGPEPDDHPPYLTGIGTFQPVKEAFIILKQLNPTIRRVGVVWNPGEQCSEACLIEARMICEALGITLVEAVASNTSEVAEAARSLISKGVEAIWIGGDTVAIAAAGSIIGQANQEGIPVFTNDPVDVKTGAFFGLGADYFTVGQLTAQLVIDILEGKSPAKMRIENVVPRELRLNTEVLEAIGNSWKITDSIANLLEKSAASSSIAQTIDFAGRDLQNNPPNILELIQANRFDNIHLLKGRPMKISVVNLVENLPLENAIKGVIQGLNESGLVEGKDYLTKHYNAQGEIGQLPQIIDAAVQERPDLIVTVTTPAFIAAASRVRDIPLVFTVASDPDRINLFKNNKVPENICGVHDDPPVDKLVDMALKHIENLEKVAIIYDAAQMNSMISVEKLRRVGKAKKLTILEATASTVSDLSMATQSLVQRGAQVLIISADNLAYTGFPAIIKVTDAAGIPIYVTEMELLKQGAEAGIGDDFFEWGVQSGKMAAKVLAGVPPSKIGIAATASQHTVEPGHKTTTVQSKKPLIISIVLYSETEFAERSYEGLIDGLSNAGLAEGRDFELKSYNAQGDMSTLSSIITTVKADRVDLLMVVSTPTLQAALRQAGPETKIIFTGVGDGVKAGAGTTETNHLDNVTGISTRSPFDGMAKLISQTLPNTRKVGTLFTPSEINSELYKAWFQEALAKQNISLVAVPVSSSAEVAQAAIELCRQDIDLVAQIVDNLTRPGFALIARKASDKNLPVFAFDSDQMKDGATLCLARDYYDAGLEAAEKAVRVLHGENPGSIPFSNTQSEKLIYNPALAEKYQLRLSSSLKENALKFENQD
ncbi:MAG: ABC transporter substrate-binding protein [Bacteroidetes bacterium]|nr:ABC transporter substrate-binding protein [Bacteroidota bacterium]MBU1579541.1 ABC transporter substrate-binding protein [Bacteroidota bacterium]MBU2557473.1 ABC transporter substrate-binding protein [Bacteroidota bacterium]